RGVYAHRVPASLERRAPADRHGTSFGSPRVMRVIAVLGAGSWGTALSVHLARQGHVVCLWARDPRLVEETRVGRANAVYLPDVSLPKGVSITHALDEALDAADLVVSAIPSHGCRAALRTAAP